jgi:hypothetical protein
MTKWEDQRYNSGNHENKGHGKQPGYQFEAAKPSSTLFAWRQEDDTIFWAIYGLTMNVPHLIRVKMLRGDGPMIDMMVEGQPLHKMMV